MKRYSTDWRLRLRRYCADWWLKTLPASSKADEENIVPTDEKYPYCVKRKKKIYRLKILKITLLWTRKKYTRQIYSADKKSKTTETNWVWNSTRLLLELKSRGYRRKSKTTEADKRWLGAVEVVILWKRKSLCPPLVKAEELIPAN